MLPERLLIIAGLTALGWALFAGLQTWHRRRAERVTPARGWPGILYFRSDHCAPCVIQGRFLAQVETQHHGQLAVETIDADQNPEMAARYGIFTLPTTLVIDGSGAVKHVNYGLADARRLAEQLQSVAVTR